MNNTLNRREASCGTTLNGKPILIVDNIYLEEMAEEVATRFS